jgi:hypothetical protein
MTAKGTIVPFHQTRGTRSKLHRSQRLIMAAACFIVEWFRSHRQTVHRSKFLSDHVLACATLAVFIAHLLFALAHRDFMSSMIKGNVSGERAPGHTPG